MGGIIGDDGGGYWRGWGSVGLFGIGGGYRGAQSRADAAPPPNYTPPPPEAWRAVIEKVEDARAQARLAQLCFAGEGGGSYGGVYGGAIGGLEGSIGLHRGSIVVP